MNEIERKRKYRQAHDLLAKANRILDWVYGECSKRTAKKSA